jgi:hypothetical protein
MRLPVGIRLLKERYFGEAARNPWVARNHLARLAEQLPPPVVPIVDEAVDLLMNYQDPDYALLYLDRIGRYVDTRSLSPNVLGEVARLMGERMAYEDLIRCAQLALEGAGDQMARPSPAAPEIVRSFTWGEVVAMLPAKAARPVLGSLQRLGFSRRTVTLRFCARSGLSLICLKLLVAMRPIRPYTYRFTSECRWIERWLHMTDRSFVKQHEAAGEVVETARLVAGSGPAYQRGVANWNAVVDGLVKPVCDGRLMVANFADAVRTARQIAADEPEGDHVKNLIAALTMRLQDTPLRANH